MERARILLSYHSTQSVSQTARELKLNRMIVNRCINKALELGVENALNDLSRKGKAATITITQDAIAWLISIACQKPLQLGFSYELWITDLLSKYARANGEKNGHTCLKNLARGTVTIILKARN